MTFLSTSFFKLHFTGCFLIKKEKERKSSIKTVISSELPRKIQLPLIFMEMQFWISFEVSFISVFQLLLSMIASVM